jgi:hypothetical protein
VLDVMAGRISETVSNELDRNGLKFTVYQTEQTRPIDEIVQSFQKDLPPAMQGRGVDGYGGSLWKVIWCNVLCAGGLRL